MELTLASLICCWCNSVSNFSCCVLSMIFFFHKNIEIQEYFHSLDLSRSSRSFHNVFRLSFSRLISKQLKIVNFAVYQKLYFKACRDVPNFLLSIAIFFNIFTFYSFALTLRYICSYMKACKCIFHSDFFQ